MRFRLATLLHLARLTAAETAGHPVCLLLMLACTTASILTPMLYLHNLGGGATMAREGALAFHLTFGLFIAGYAASVALTRELRDGTAAAVLARPVSRAGFFLAKFGGIVIVIGAFSLAATVSALLATRIGSVYNLTFEGAQDMHTAAMALGFPVLACAIAAVQNYRRGVAFQSRAFWLIPCAMLVALALAACFDHDGSWAPFDPRVEPAVLQAALLIALALCTLAAIALTLSVRLARIPVLALTALTLLAGLVSDYVLGRAAATSHVARFAYLLIPNWQHFWLSDAIGRGMEIPAAYIAGVSLYALLYTGGVLLAGIALIRHADIS